MTRAVHDNLRNLGVEVLDVVNLRVWGDLHSPTEDSIEESFTTLAELQRQGLIRHLGLSNVTAAQVKQAQGIAQVICVQNHYNLTHRDDEQLIADLGRQGIAYVPFFPPGWLHTAAIGNPFQRGDAPAGITAVRGSGVVTATGAEYPADSRYVVVGASAGKPHCE